MENFCENYICPCNKISFLATSYINSNWFKFVQLIAGTKIFSKTPHVTQNELSLQLAAVLCHSHY